MHQLRGILTERRLQARRCGAKMAGLNLSSPRKAHRGSNILIAMPATDQRRSTRRPRRRRAKETEAASVAVARSIPALYLRALCRCMSVPTPGLLCGAELRSSGN